MFSSSSFSPMAASGGDWRLRQAAESVLQSRRRFQTQHQQQQELSKWTTAAQAATSGRKSSSNKVPQSALTLASAVDDFHVEAAFELVRVSKQDSIVPATFDAAAQAVVHAMLRHTDDEEDEEDDEDYDADMFAQGHVPAVFQDRQLLANIRQAALLRSLDNKEWAKKKVRTNDGSGGPGAGATGAGSKGPGRKRKTVVVESPVNNSNNNNDSGSNTPQAEAVVSSTASDGDPEQVASSSPGPAPQSGLSGSNPTTGGSTAGPKFTRNTPASSAAALDFRFTNSRAILCAAGNLVFSELTPHFTKSRDDRHGDDDDDSYINGTSMANEDSDGLEGDGKKNGAGISLEATNVPQKNKNVNLGAVVVDADIYAKRTIAMARNAIRRSRLRYKFRRDNAKAVPRRNYLRLPHLFQWQHQHHDSLYSSEPEDYSPPPKLWDDFVFDEDDVIMHEPNETALTDAWNTFCLPRLLDILSTGSGHALYHDIQWYNRHARIADLFRSLQQGERESFGPHLIVTTQPDVIKFSQEFYDMRSEIRLVWDDEDDIKNTRLRVLVYEGPRRDRNKLRKFFAQATGLPEAPFHVIVVSYWAFLEDYLHFCQLPFDIVVLDDGASWMAASAGDPNSSLATMWDYGIWSRNDQHTGLAGTRNAAAEDRDADGRDKQSNTHSAESWDFTSDEFTDSAIKHACIGLTARHRIMTASQLFHEQRMSVELLPVSGVVSFLVPNFASVVQEEWDRSNIAKDAASMQHFRLLVARSMVIHHESSPLRDMHEMALVALEGQMGLSERFGEPAVPHFLTDEEFVSSEKVTFSRRGCLAWLGTNSNHWLRYELGAADFQPIIAAMKASSKHGHFCEEITTASSTTASGATGQVSGTLAYRCAVTCGRHFGSEQGLRQHISAQHAPPGTWLCRTCWIDCVTSQARTHHERTCGQPSSGTTGEPNGSVGATPTVGQGGAKAGVGKKKSQRSVSTQQGGVSPEEKDSDGSLRVPGYRGVWVNKDGKHFIKIKGKRYNGDDGGDQLVLFESNDAAASKYDEVISRDAVDKSKLELNFKPDGTRNIYEDATSSTASGLGGSAANVVPLLSVINIKDLPPDVKPLLRDPRQTSRTGGNSKRHVYAYRGVCRQARKGHDRWQSQISFLGVNHYLGTFDSEWDAAAIYAWAHLILYGEEATRQAQKEGEEAAAAYEQEKRDIAAGKIPEPPPKPESKKKTARKRTETTKPKPGKRGRNTKGDASNNGEDGNEGQVKKRKTKQKETVMTGGRSKADAKTEKEAMNALLSIGATKTSVLMQRDMFENTSLGELQAMASRRIQAARSLLYKVGDLEQSASPALESLRPCLPVVDVRGTNALGVAMLAGLPQSLGWNLESFMDSNVPDEAEAAAQALAVEYDEDGVNEKFRSVLQGSVCILGRASNRMVRQFQETTDSSIAPGCGIGTIDCHVGGPKGSCSEQAACIRFAGEEFQISCLNDSDVVTLNGQRLVSGMGGISLADNDVCCVGARVFVFLLPK